MIKDIIIEFFIIALELTALFVAISFAVNLLHKKVRFGIVMVFLFSSPLLDPTIITLMAAIGSVIYEAVPTEWIATYLGGDKWWLVPIAAVIGIPLYVRIETMIPLSKILIAKGMAFPPVMALMIGSVGSSIPVVALLNSIFHKRLVVAFVASVITMSTLSGFLFYLI